MDYKEKKVFKYGDRVYHEEMGYGTVDTPTYNTIHFTTWTCVKYDDYLNQAFPLCGETEELRLAWSYEETMEAFNEAITDLGYSPKEALRDLEECMEGHPKAMDEIRTVVKYGV